MSSSLRRFGRALLPLSVVVFAVIQPADQAAATPKSASDVVSEGDFTPLTPARILDTRDGTGGVTQPIGPGQTIDVLVTGVGGVPPTGVGSVVFNATAVDPTSATYLTVWPAGIARPANSNLNVRQNETRPNLVTVAVGAGGKVSIYNNAGTTHAIVDVVGFYSDATGPASSRFHPVDPSRLFDTRDGSGGVPVGPIAGAGVLSVSVASRGTLPASGTTAIVLNVTVTQPTSSGYLTVFPGDVPAPKASNLNFVAGQTVPNLVTVRVPESGIISFLNSAGATHVVADIVGFYDTQRADGAGRFIGVTPARAADTRLDNDPLLAGDFGILPIAGYDGVPDSAAAAVLNVTVTNTTAPGFLTVFPDDACYRPLVSNLNFLPGDTVANLAIVRLSRDDGCAVGVGHVDVFNSAGSTDVIVDVFGYFTAP